MALYTPVVFPEDSNAAAFESSLPSLSSISGFSPNLTYLEDLQRKHHALAQIVREEPPTPPRLPSSDKSEDEDGHGYEEAAFLAAREERIAVLKQRVREAFIEADGNPADGKWALVARLLKMESTSGQYGRWSGTRTDRRPPEPLEGDGIGWINAKTEVEWNEWEKKYLEERKLKDKVENWQRRVLPPSKGPSLAIEGHLVGSVHVDVGAGVVVPVPNEPSTSNQAEQPQASKTKVTLKAGAGTGSISQIQNQLAAASSLTDPLRDAAPFGFGVVKRASQNTNSTGGKPSKPTGNGNHKKQPSADRPNGPPGGDVPPEPSSSKNKDKNKETEIQRIDELPDASFLHSFSSSQILTSTPKPAAKRPLASSSSKAVIGISNSPPQRRLQPQGPHIPAPLFPLSPIQSPSSAATPRVAPPVPVSPRVTKTYGRHTPAGTPMRTPLNVSASLPDIPIPTTPTRKLHAAPPAAVNAGAGADSPPTVINANNKREREPTFITPRRHDEPSTSNANANAPLTPNTNQNQNRREEEDVERALKRARTLSAYELLTSSSPGPSMGDNRNKSPYRQTLTGFALAAAAASRSPRMLKAAVHHVTPIVSRSEGAGIGSPSTPTPTPGPMRGTRAKMSSGVPPPPVAQAPSTPPPPARADKLPTLTELLASDRKKKEKKKKVRTSVSGSTSVSASGVKPASSPTKGKGKFAVEPIREVPESDLEEGWVGSGVGAGAIATAGAHVEANAHAATGESARQVQAEIQNEPQSAQSLNSTNTNSFPHSNNSYPNAPAYSYPITEDNHNFLHPHSLLDLVDPHGDVDPYADPPPPVPELEFEREFHREIEHDSIFGGGGGYDPYDVDVDLASPAKSLSSIAGSDDDDSEEEVDQLAGDLDVFRGEGRLGKGFEFRPMAASTQQGPFGGAGAGAATANVGVDAPRPGISQGSKDSWESVYAPKSSTGDAPTSASHRPQNGSHPSSPRSNSNSQVLLSSHLHPRHVLTPSSSNPFAHVDYARTPSILNVLAHGRGHGHLSAQAQVQAHIRTPSSSNPFKYAYNSQFESNVAKEVEKVNKLLESEIRVDYDGWLRDPDEGEGDESKGVEESP